MVCINMADCRNGYHVDVFTIVVFREMIFIVPNLRRNVKRSTFLFHFPILFLFSCFSWNFSNSSASFSKAKDGVKILVDEDELSREKEAKVAEFARWNRIRAEMKKRREDELAARNQEKIKQIQDYEALQV